ncbi:MAG: pyridoxamine 5'-phosphate oxidase family protein [Gemmatimonadales bacterium]
MAQALDMAQAYEFAQADSIQLPFGGIEGRTAPRTADIAPPARAGHRSPTLRLLDDEDEGGERKPGAWAAMVELGRWAAHAFRVAMWTAPTAGECLHADPATLRGLIRKSRVALLTTRDRCGKLHTRPMAPTRRLFDGEIWFATPDADPLLDHVRARAPVQVTYLDRETNRSLVLNGVARVCQRATHGAGISAMMPRRQSAPPITFIRVDVMSADVWE